ncbi:mechanosensitive ion channel family protein [unidentified eubacterium SCB49]|nr:mechanosensitive ion channel family protein [unidentified eubacterium SCB49]
MQETTVENTSNDVYEKFQNIEFYINKYGQKLIDYLPDILSAIVILVLGWWLVKLIVKLAKKVFEARSLETSLQKFLLDLISWVLKVILFITVVAQLGIETSSFVAIVGAAGLAVGLALQGSLANFAGGVLILLFKPFKVGHFIKAQGVEGTVKEISIISTKLLTFGNQLAVIPNGKLSNDTIVNFTEEGIRRENLTIGISYDSDIKKAKEILLALLMEQDLILKGEGQTPMVAVAELADSSVNLTVRFWAKLEDFWNIKFFTIEEAKSRLEAEGISLPFPQRDVHLIGQEKE